MPWCLDDLYPGTIQALSGGTQSHFKTRNSHLPETGTENARLKALDMEFMKKPIVVYYASPYHMFASTPSCSNIAIFRSVNPKNSRFCICLPMDELRLGSDLREKEGL